MQSVYYYRSGVLLLVQSGYLPTRCIATSAKHLLTRCIVTCAKHLFTHPTLVRVIYLTQWIMAGVKRSFTDQALARSVY